MEEGSGMAGCFEVGCDEVYYVAVLGVGHNCKIVI
jgi:hypothetical protein